MTGLSSVYGLTGVNSKLHVDLYFVTPISSFSAFCEDTLQQSALSV